MEVRTQLFRRQKKGTQAHKGQSPGESSGERKHRKPNPPTWEQEQTKKRKQSNTHPKNSCEQTSEELGNMNSKEGRRIELGWN